MVPCPKHVGCPQRMRNEMAALGSSLALNCPARKMETYAAPAQFEAARAEALVVRPAATLAAVWDYQVDLCAQAPVTHAQHWTARCPSWWRCLLGPLPGADLQPWPSQATGGQAAHSRGPVLLRLARA